MSIEAVSLTQSRKKEKASRRRTVLMARALGGPFLSRISFTGITRAG